jgi:hypothetical protein
LIGLRVTAGELVGVSIKLVGEVATGVGIGNANVGEATADAVADRLGAGEAVGPGDTVGLGEGEGGMIFSQ